MGRPKKTTKSTEPVQPEIQPEVVSENFSVPFEEAGALDETLQAEEGETQPPVLGVDCAQPEGAFSSEEAPLEIPDISDEEGQAGAEALSAEAAAETPETNVVTNLPTLQEGEELYTVTKADLETNPDLAEQGVEEGEQIILGPAVTPEDAILSFLVGEEDFVEINEVLEQFVNDAESQQGNKFLKKLLTGMVASGEIDVQNQVHLLLGAPYYKSGDPVTRYQTLRTVPVWAKKRS